MGHAGAAKLLRKNRTVSNSRRNNVSKALLTADSNALDPMTGGE